MALARLDELLEKAKKGKYAVGAYDFVNLEQMYGILEAAEETGTSIILQFPEGFEQYGRVEHFGKAIVSAAHAATVPVAVHLDHGFTVEMVKKCIDVGFTSVMIDASAKPLMENIEAVREIVELCEPMGIPVEAELGHVGEAADYNPAHYLYTDPDMAREFVEATGISALAVAIGNAHGAYMSTPQLNFDVLTEIGKRTDVPLVLHGASGIPDGDIKKAISLGITKINIFTELAQESLRRMEETAREKPLDIFSVNECFRDGFKSRVKQKIALFGTR